MPTLADVVRRHGPDYLRRFGAGILPSHVRALDDIVRCRTPALGGHVAVCNHCDEEHVLFHSCRNRSCPRCGHDTTARWLEGQRKLLLPVPYFHVVFTLPDELRRLVRSHQRGRRARPRRPLPRRSDRRARRPAHLDADARMASSRAHARSGRWPRARRPDLAALAQEEATIPRSCARPRKALPRPIPRPRAPRTLHHRAGRGIPTHSSHKVLTLPAEEMLRRFLQHVPPKGMHRVRAFGLLHRCSTLPSVTR